eukprot:TRINITY_DN1735_c0_g1_i1.p1 TRINITY_DN1735_c0_g1~~TRINITY_DN1735_c0_g1_i1.p1  ORF type:complete len:691 (-),score=217.33 TRINITY_DN1735_c0_g1_i1:102-2174(-)
MDEDKVDSCASPAEFADSFDRQRADEEMTNSYDEFLMDDDILINSQMDASPASNKGKKDDDDDDDLNSMAFDSKHKSVLMEVKEENPKKRILSPTNQNTLYCPPAKSSRKAFNSSPSPPASQKENEQEEEEEDRTESRTNIPKKDVYSTPPNSKPESSAPECLSPFTFTLPSVQSSPIKPNPSPAKKIKRTNSKSNFFSNNTKSSSSSTSTKSNSKSPTTHSTSKPKPKSKPATVLLDLTSTSTTTPPSPAKIVFSPKTHQIDSIPNQTQTKPEPKLSESPIRFATNTKSTQKTSKFAKSSLLSSSNPKSNTSNRLSNQNPKLLSSTKCNSSPSLQSKSLLSSSIPSLLKNSSPSSSSSSSKPASLSSLRSSFFQKQLSTPSTLKSSSSSSSSSLRSSNSTPSSSNTTETKDMELVNNLYTNIQLNADYDHEENQPPQLLVPLLQYQRQGLSWMLSRESSSCTTSRGGILSDAMGLGKTVQALALILSHKYSHPKPPSSSTTLLKSNIKPKQLLQPGTSNNFETFPTLIVAPLSMVDQWLDEIRLKVQTGALKFQAYYGANRVKDAVWLRSFDVILTTYGTLVSEFSNKATSCLYQIQFYRVILDEAQMIKNFSTRTTQAAIKLNSHKRWCLSGTPIQNSIEELYSFLHFIHYSEFNDNWWWKTMIIKPIKKNDDKGFNRLINILHETSQ